MIAKKSHRRRGNNKGSNSPAATATLNTALHPHAAGIDIGAEEIVAAVAAGRDLQCVRTFESFTSGVLALRDWLLGCGITTVAMESTGNYWITTYDLLEEAGMEVFLVNARHVKGVPGKKTDVQDAQWLQQLHAAGLLRKSFRPGQDIVPLRYLMRHRQGMVAQSSLHVQLMQKVLTEMNVKIQHVFSDVDGVSAQAIIDAILAGERDPHKLAALRDRRCRSPLADIIEALKGTYRPEYLFVLRQNQSAWRALQQAITQCDEQLTVLSAKVGTPAAGPLPPTSTRRKIGKNGPQMNIFEEAWRYYEVDLSEVPGVSTGLLSVLMSEIGTRAQMGQAFRSAEAFASWLGLCPDNRISGGRVLKAKTRKVASRMAGALRMGVFGLNLSETKMGEYTRRMKGRLGKAEGLTAAAHKLARILYAMIITKTAYCEETAFQITPRSLERRRQKLVKQAAELGFQLIAAA